MRQCFDKPTFFDGCNGPNHTIRRLDGAPDRPELRGRNVLELGRGYNGFSR